MYVLIFKLLLILLLWYRFRVGILQCCIKKTFAERIKFYVQIDLMIILKSAKSLLFYCYPLVFK